MGSTSNCTPFLSSTVSSSLTASSKVKPYWKPEQPPPCTNTRSFSSGLPSSSSRSLTLAAAESVKTNGIGGAWRSTVSVTAFMVELLADQSANITYKLAGTPPQYSHSSADGAGVQNASLMVRDARTVDPSRTLMTTVSGRNPSGSSSTPSLR